MLQPGDALFQRAVVGRLGNAEEVVIVAALLAGVLNHRGIVGAVERDEVDPADIVIETIFERANTGFGVVRDRSRRRCRMSGGRAHKVVERQRAAAVELNETWLETFSAPVLEIGFDRLDVALDVVHMTVRRLLAVLWCHRFRLSRPAGRSMARAGCAAQPTSPGDNVATLYCLPFSGPTHCGGIVQ